jgi:hypothetical protein
MGYAGGSWDRYKTKVDDINLVPALADVGVLLSLRGERERKMLKQALASTKPNTYASVSHLV